jgi:hypothetical protein
VDEMVSNKLLGVSGFARPARDAVEAVVCRGQAATLRWSAGRASPASSNEREREQRRMSGGFRWAV